ncbi:MAG: phage terminase large subunit [Pseudomonadota bacterium]
MSSEDAAEIDRRGGLITFRQFVWLWNKAQGLSTPALHLEIATWLEQAWRTGDERLLLMVFRDAGKSTLVGLFCGWLLANDSNLRVLVVAAEQGLATKMVRNVRGVLERHPVARAVVSPASGAWASDALTLQRERELRDPSMLARGIGANLTGTRADVVICDDVEVPNTVDTPTKRADLRRRMAELSFILVPGGLQLCIGTPHSHETIYADEAQVKADERPFLADYNRLVLPIVDEAGRSRWPQRFPPKKIRALESEVGPSRFKSQMMLQPVDLRDVRLDAGRLVSFAADVEVVSLNRTRELRLDGRRLKTVQCWWDPAYGSPKGGDGSVVAVAYTDEHGAFWLIDLAYLRHDPSVATQVDEATQLCRQVVALARRHACPSMTLETNGIGRFLPNLLRKAVRDVGARIAVREHSTSRNKDQRIVEAFDPVLAARSLHVHERVLETPFLEEMRNFVPGAQNRDDGLDAVAACILEPGVGVGELARADTGSFVATADFRP